MSFMEKFSFFKICVSREEEGENEKNSAMKGFCVL